jgi:hypothetical protein
MILRMSKMEKMEQEIKQIKENMEILLATTIKNDDVNQLENKMRETEGRENEGLRKWKLRRENELLADLKKDEISSLAISEEKGSNKESSDESENGLLKISNDSDFTDNGENGEESESKKNGKSKKKEKKKETQKRQGRKKKVKEEKQSTNLLLPTKVSTDINFYDSPFSAVSPLSCSNYFASPSNSIAATVAISSTVTSLASFPFASTGLVAAAAVVEKEKASLE